MIRLPALVALGAMVGLSACGSDDSATPAVGGSNGALTVVADDISLSSSTYSTTSGTVVVTYRNEGSLEHTLLIEGVAGFKLDVPTQGDVDEDSVTLQPGEYAIYCDIVGHREAGMEATLVIA